MCAARRFVLVTCLCFALFVTYVLGQDAVSVCRGEGARYGDHKCNHDETHRVCAQLLDDKTHTPLKKWGREGNQSFWEITVHYLFFALLFAARFVFRPLSSMLV
eukprot:TRINITY_DN4953_c1_g2_i1.p1 TRINITY_DN4953_c1_g2~~TRINITY_DN4953_c1_g2_i1.p1  ORF type:complete len:104 (+),score=7.20 TRINITY_DN4953_c1_g2_i1:81-392(+)